MTSTPSVDERARLIATADMVLAALKEVRTHQPADADVPIVERWIARVAGVRENLDAITECSSAEAYEVNWICPGPALRRLFPTGLGDAEIDAEIDRLEHELERDWRERPREPAPEMSDDDTLEDLLTGHGSARFRFVDVRSVDAWRRQRLQYGTNIPLEKLTAEAPRTFRKDAVLVVYGNDSATTQDAADQLERLGYRRSLTIPGGFDWFVRRGWQIDLGPS